MISFPTKYAIIYNKIIHNFLEVEIFCDDEVKEERMGDVIEEILPKYLYREQFEKCMQKLEDIYNWTEDSFLHDLTVIHELILYNFLSMLENEMEENKDFANIYFDKEIKEYIERTYKKLNKKFNEKGDFGEDKILFYDIFTYADSLFTDTDFLFVDKLYNLRKFELTELETLLGINIDYYFELLPMDIQKSCKNKHLTLTGEIVEFLRFLEHRIEFGNLNELFWNNDVAVDEERIQVIIDNLMDSYFHEKDLEITREAIIGNGKVDFKVYRNKEEKLLIEIKKASSSAWRKGYENQLLEYIKSSECKNAFYLIVCFTDQEYKKIKEFIRNHVYTDEYQLYINIAILDVRKKIAPSKL